MGLLRNRADGLAIGKAAQPNEPLHEAWDETKAQVGPKVSISDWVEVSSAHHGIRDSCDPQSITLWVTL